MGTVANGQATFSDMFTVAHSLVAAPLVGLFLVIAVAAIWFAWKGI